jgi:RHS repeat-associated protein
MQLSSGTPIPDGILAAIALRNEKPRLGVPSRNPALHQGIDAANSTIVLGLQSTAALNRIGSRCTGKERDQESGLDYFGARYYGSTMGRFLSPDWAAKAMPVPYAKLDNPQTLNLYAYVGNNPLSRTDPTGHYVCSGSKDQCAAIQTGLNLAKAAQEKLGADSKGGKAIGAVLKFYGAAGEKNGVNVGFGNLDKGTLGQERAGANGTTNIKFDLGQINAAARGSSNGGVFGITERSGVEIHEGQHGVDDRVRGGGTDSRRALDATEHNAYGTESYVFQGLGANSAQGLWNTNWTPGNMEANRGAAVDAAAAGSVAADCEGGGCRP